MGYFFGFILISISLGMYLLFKKSAKRNDNNKNTDQDTNA
jgi:hypothetical protein